MAADKPPDPPKPDRYDRNRITFRTDRSSREFAIRPGQFLASSYGGIDSVLDRIHEVLAEIRGDREIRQERRDRVDVREELRGPWTLYQIDPSFDVLRVIEGLRVRGIPTQPNHVYFMTSRRRTAGLRFNPNLFAPNLFAPNLFAPNLFAGGPGCGCGQACPDRLSDGEDRDIPTHAARSAGAGPGADPVPDQQVDAYVIDVGGPPPKTNVDDNGDAWIDPVTGHGQFVRSVFQLTSGMDCKLISAGSSLGDIDDVELVAALDDVHRGSDPTRARILNLSLAGYNEDDRPGSYLADQVGQMIEAGWIIVASAGNNASCRLTWPAALPDVIAVGAMAGNEPAWFSNYGPWVDASAQGVDVVAEFPDLSDYHDLKLAIESGRTLTGADLATGWARWSGTSFSAPRVAARLAEAWHDALVAGGSTVATSRDAALDAVLDGSGTVRLPHFGTIVA